jgi:hypothetical protein
MAEQENKLPAKVVSTLVYLRSLLIPGEELTVSITPQKVVVVTGKEPNVNLFELDANYKINPIQDILEHLNEQMCVDCVKSDYNFQNEYFGSLIRGYVDGLVHEFGMTVPIPPELAKAIVKHGCSSYKIIAKKDEDVVALSAGYKDELFDHLVKKKWVFYLKASGSETKTTTAPSVTTEDIITKDEEAKQ